jgi:hypothetical protein
MTHPLPTTLATTEREKALNTVFTTALEGGINYWSACSVYRWSVDVDGRQEEAKDFIAVITETEDEDEPEHVIDYHVVRRGANRLYKHLIDLGDEANQYHLRAMRDLARGNWDDLDFDADTADMVVQFGLFGELVYA